MKLIIFTLDAIFALIIAVTAVSVLGYFFYYPQTTATISYSSAATALQTLSSTTVGSIAQQSALFSAIAYQANASGEVWDQYGGNIYHTASNAHGPSSPFISFIFNAISEPTNLSIDYGKVFFGAGNTLYAINATNGNLFWKKTTGSTIYGDPAISSGMLIYPNATNLTAVNPSTNALIWSSSGVASMSYLDPYPSPLLVYNNKIYLAGKVSGSATDLAYYLNNGTNAWEYPVPSGGYSLAIASGSILIAHAGNLFNLMDDVGTSAKAIWSSYLSPTLGFAVVPGSSIIALSGATQANAIYVNGIKVSGFPYNYPNTATQPAVYNNVIYYQSSSAIIAVTSGGIELWSSTPPSSVGSSSSWDTVVASAKTVYTEWSNNYIVATNTSTGSTLWYTQVPTQLGTLEPGDMALAYGRLYVVAGNYLIAYGACNSGISASILSSAASLYSNGQAGCADALVNGVAPMQNYSIFLNGTFAPSMNLATFTGTNSYAENPSSAPLNNLQTFTISGWVYPTSYSLTTQGPYIYSEGQPAVTMSLEMLPSGSLYGATWNQGTWNAISGLSVPLNTWSFIAFSLGIGGKTGTYSLYLNNQRITGPGQPEESSPTIYSGIGFDVGSLAGQPNNYFSGGIANLQIYNETLTQGQVAQIYQGGIQSSPLQGTGLQAWYPLAGDTNDYSGLAGHTMYPVNVLFSAGNYLPIGYSNAYQLSKATQLIPVTNSITGLSRLYNVGVISWH